MMTVLHSPSRAFVSMNAQGWRERAERMERLATGCFDPELRAYYRAEAAASRRNADRARERLVIHALTQRAA